MRTLAVLSILVSTTAFAGELPCAPAEAGTINLDGMPDDWQEVAALENNDGHAGIALRCNTQGRLLYLDIEVSDDRIVRTKQARDGEDHLELSLGGKRYKIFPASDREKVKVVPGGWKAASAASGKGFVVELAAPLSSFKPKAGALERLPMSLRFFDCDTAAALKTERTVGVEGELAFTGGPSTLDAFLHDRGLVRSHVRWQKPIRVVQGQKTTNVQLVLAGKLVAVLGEGYAYVELPVSDGTDVRNPQLVDLAGDGRTALVLEYIERGGGGERTVLAAFRPAGNGIQRIFAAEIGKRTDAGKLSSKVELKRHGKATDIILTAQPAAGLTADSYKEAPATDIVPILLPWSTDNKKATFSFTGDAYQRR